MKHENEKKEIVLLLKPMTKTSQLNGKSKEDVFRRVFSLKWHFKMVAWRCLFIEKIVDLSMRQKNK